MGFASSLVGAAVHLIWALLFYELFRRVNRTISLLAVFFVIVCCVMQALAGLFYIAPLLVLDDAGSLASFSTEQLQSIVAIFLKLNEATFEIDLVFFGLWCVLTGWLIYKSGFMPRLIGILLMIDGLGWFLFIAPPVAHQLFPVIALTSALGEIPLMIYLLVVGLNVKRWNELTQLQRN